MVNDLPTQYLEEELDRNAFNAAFNELGLRWHWDCDTYFALLRERADAPARVRHYLESQQPHLLRAYDVDFLGGVILDKTAEHKRRLAQAGSMATTHFNWAETLGREIGI